MWGDVGRKVFVGVALLALVAGAAACSGGSSGGAGGPGGSQPAPVPTTGPPVEGDPYTHLEGLAGELGATVAGRVEVAARATELCSLQALGSLGASLQDLPDDLAIVRSYCPEVEAAYPP